YPLALSPLRVRSFPHRPLGARRARGLSRVAGLDQRSRVIAGGSRRDDSAALGSDGAADGRARAGNESLVHRGWRAGVLTRTEYAAGAAAGRMLAEGRSGGRPGGL